jgi:hypothetical protein
MDYKYHIVVAYIFLLEIYKLRIRIRIYILIHKKLQLIVI